MDRQDYAEGTILPGLVDAHSHLVAPGDGTLGDDIAKEGDDILLLQAARNARTLLHSGVTTLRENGANGRVAFSLREGIRRQIAHGGAQRPDSRDHRPLGRARVRPCRARRAVTTFMFPALDRWGGGGGGAALAPL